MPKIGLSFNGQLPLERTIKYVKLAETYRFDSVWFAEHFFFRDALISIAATADCSKTLRYGTGIIVPYTRSLGLLSISVETLSEILPGRFILGLGTGQRFWKVFGIRDEKPVRTMRNTIARLQALQLGEKTALADDGKVDVGLDFRSGHRVPIYLGAINPMMLRLAGEVADGIILGNGTPPSYAAQAIRHVVEGIEKAGRKREDVEVVGYVLGLGDNEEKTIRLAKQRFVVLLTVPGEAEMFRGTEYESQIARIRSVHTKEGLERASELVSQDLLEQVMVPASPDGCIEKIREYRRAGVTLPTVSPTGSQDYGELLKYLSEE